MADEIRIDGMTIAHSVIETVVNLAAEAVPEVATVGTSAMSGLANLAFGKSSEPSVEAAEDGKSLIIRVHVSVYYGNKLVDVAEKIRTTVAEAIVAQIGIEVSRVDIYVDGIVFNKQ